MYFICQGTYYWESVISFAQFALFRISYKQLNITTAAATTTPTALCANITLSFTIAFELDCGENPNSESFLCDAA